MLIRSLEKGCVVPTRGLEKETIKRDSGPKLCSAPPRAGMKGCMCLSKDTLGTARTNILGEAAWRAQAQVANH